MAAQTNASAMPVLPEVGSTTTDAPGVSSPEASAASIIDSPMRSLTEPAGLNDSSLPRITAPEPSEMRAQPHQRRAADEIDDGVGDRHPGDPTIGPGGQTAAAASAARSAWGRAPRCEMTSEAASDPSAAHSASGRPCVIPWRKPAA